MPTIKKILFPVDFSKGSVAAARYVEALAGRFQAELMLLHVVGDGEHTLASELYAARKAKLDGFLVDELKYFTTRRECVAGDPTEEIVEVARSWNPDLVMMATYGLGHFRRLLLGSTAAKVLHDLECPVWTNVHSEQTPPLESITCRCILCAVGLDSQSASALNWAAFLAGEYQAELIIVHAVPAVEASAPARFLDAEFSASLKNEARKRIMAMEPNLKTNAAIFIDAGEPAKVVAEAARRFSADLLVIGRHARAGLAGHLRHNAYAMLRESPCPVLSV
jgi:nucleotide-binding universal stress UspA family protein